MAEKCAAVLFNDEGFLTGICKRLATHARDELDLLVCEAHRDGVITYCEGCARRPDACACPLIATVKKVKTVASRDGGGV